MHDPVDLAPFAPPVRSFVAQVLARWPGWYDRVTPSPDGNGVRLEVPSPGDPTLTLWADVWPGEATVGLGYRAAEQCFAWSGPPQGDQAAYSEVVAFLARVIAGEVVLAWRRERFLLWTAVKGRFCTTEEAVADRRIVGVQLWHG